MVICGVIIAGLGVLNDVTITQASAVWELADSGQNNRKLFTRAMRIGRDHIASTVYTIAFATAGASLSVLLLIAVYNRPLFQVLQTEQFASEIVRTLVGSIGLVLAVPLTTAIGTAVVRATGGRSRAASKPLPRSVAETGSTTTAKPRETGPGAEAEDSDLEANRRTANRVETAAPAELGRRRRLRELLGPPRPLRPRVEGPPPPVRGRQSGSCRRPVAVRSRQVMRSVNVAARQPEGLPRDPANGRVEVSRPQPVSLQQTPLADQSARRRVQHYLWRDPRRACQPTTFASLPRTLAQVDPGGARGGSRRGGGPGDQPRAAGRVDVSSRGGDGHIGRATLYKYFPDVEKVLTAWHERHVSSHLVEMMALRDRGGTPSARLRRCLWRTGTSVSSGDGTVPGELAEVMHRTERVQTLQRQLVELVAELVGEAAAEGVVRGDVPAQELAAFVVHALGAADDVASDAALNRLVDLVWSGMAQPVGGWISE